MAEILKGKSHSEMINFFKKAGDAVREEARRRRRTEPEAQSYG
jgi:hypothetical protein